MSEQMTGAQAAVAQLLAEGVDTVLGIPGVHNLPICDALLDHPQLRFLHGRHEQGIAFMANGYARANNRIAVSLVITGPGVTNSLTPLADAYLDSVPMVLIAASVEPERAGKGAFHELRDQTGVLRAVTKWTALAGSVEEVPEAIHAAFVEAYGGRPGPTAVEIPLSVQRASGQVDVHPAARPPRQAAQHIIRFVALHFCPGNIKGIDQLADPFYLRSEILGHFFPSCFVLGKDLIAERLSGIENYR